MQYVEVPNQLGNKRIVDEFDEVVKGSGKDFDIPHYNNWMYLKKIEARGVKGIINLLWKQTIEQIYENKKDEEY